MSAGGRPRAAPDMLYRHPLPVRAWHWLNAACIVVLLMSGLMIFNTGPFLAWGEEGHLDMPTLAAIRATDIHGPSPRSTLQIGRWTFDTSGILGVPRETRWGVVPFALPPWMTFPPSFDLHLARGWHFLIAWVFVLNGLAYGVYGLASGHFRRRLLPAWTQLRPRAVLADLARHLRLRPLLASDYNLLQKLAYLAVVFVVLPVQVLSGLTMANGVTAAFPELFDLFGGRQSARTVHFLGALALVGFVAIHVFQVFIAGFRNEMRAMITGRWLPPRAGE